MPFAIFHDMPFAFENLIVSLQDLNLIRNKVCPEIQKVTRDLHTFLQQYKCDAHFEGAAQNVDA